jgi:hypothetical protein
MTALSARAGERRTITGPIRPPTRSPRPSGSTTDQRTGPKTEHDVLDRIATRQRFAGGEQEQCEQHHAGPRAEIAAVHTDHTDTRHNTRTDAMWGGGLDLVDESAPGEDRQRCDRDQERHDPLEGTGWRHEQQDRADGPSDDPGGSELADARPLPGQLRTRSDDRPGAAEDQSNGVRHVRSDGRQAECEQCRIADQRGKAGDAARQPSADASEDEYDRLARGHRDSLTETWRLRWLVS